MLTAPLRRELSRIVADAEANLARLWRQVSTASEAREALNDILPALVSQYGSGAAFAASVWYDDLRSRGAARGAFRAVPVDLGASGAGPLVGHGTRPLDAAEPDWDAAKAFTAGGVQRRIANYSRETIVRATDADPGARGWRREGMGECAWCAAQISAGTVFPAGARLASHDACGCQPAPAFA